ncbi:MAG TPA: hypothetical protein VFD98_01385, partial [Terracidiphilus sp.]|nr:hypothetical protein [Terracidiphilus sp.]
NRPEKQAKNLWSFAVDSFPSSSGVPTPYSVSKFLHSNYLRRPCAAKVLFIEALVVESPPQRNYGQVFKRAFHIVDRAAFLQ